MRLFLELGPSTAYCNSRIVLLDSQSSHLFSLPPLLPPPFPVSPPSLLLILILLNLARLQRWCGCCNGILVGRLLLPSGQKRRRGPVLLGRSRPVCLTTLSHITLHVLPKICSRTLMDFFVPSLKGGRINPPTTARCSVTCCVYFLLTCALLMTSSHSKAPVARFAVLGPWRSGVAGTLPADPLGAQYAATTRMQLPKCARVYWWGYHALLSAPPPPTSSTPSSRKLQP